MITYEGMEYRVKEYLSDIHSRIKDIDAILARIDDIEHQMSGLHGVRYKDSPISSTVNKDAIPNCIIELEEARTSLSEEVALHNEEINQAWNICRPHASENRYALWLHYVQGMGWSKVSKALFVCKTKVFEMRYKGIIELYDAMPQRWREGYNEKYKAEE